MNNLLIRQYQETKSKYFKFAGRLQRSYETGEFYRLPGRKQNWLVSRVKKLWERLKTLEKQLKLAIAAGTITMLLTFSDVTQAQPNFIPAPDKNPCPPPYVYGSSPIINDVDNDGDLDILTTQSDAYIMWYKNTGSASVPDFEKVPDNQNPFLFPDSLDMETWNINAIADIDGDGDKDIFADTYQYSGGFFKNIGTASNPEFEAAENPLSFSYNEGILLDMDDDGDLDLVDTEGFSYYDPISMNWISTIKIRTYQNIGTPHVPVIDYNNPVYFDIANQTEPANFYNDLIPMDWGDDNDNDFFIQAEYYDAQKDNYYTKSFVIENSGTDQSPQFAFLDDADNPFLDIPLTGSDQEIFPVDLDNDGDIDALVNESYVGLAFYRNTGITLVRDESLEDFNGFLLTYSYVTPAFMDYDGDGDLDLYTFGYEYEMPPIYYENTGDAHTPEYIPGDDYFPFIQLTGSDYFYPIFADIDSDGDLDCFTFHYEEYSGMIVDYYKNTGTQQSPDYQLDNYNNPIPLLEDIYSLPSFADFDGDGDLDMIYVAEEGGYPNYDYSSVIRYYKNTGTPDLPEFTLIDDNRNPFYNLVFDFELYGSPLVVADLDMDGDYDVFLNDYYGKISYLENTGTPTSPIFSLNEADNPLKNISTGYYGGFSLVDLDGDGDKDLFVTSLYNTIVTYYINTDPRTSSSRQEFVPRDEFVKVYPNPASGYCSLEIDSPVTGICELKVIDIHGQVLKTENFRKVNGFVQHQLDVSSLAPGVYMIDVTQGNQRYISRLVVE